MNEQAKLINGLTQAWRDENASARNYRALAEREPNPDRKAILLRLAEAEVKHAVNWQVRLKELGADPGDYQESAGDRTRRWLLVQSGTESAVVKLEAMENEADALYDDLLNVATGHDREQIAEAQREEEAHAKVLNDMTGAFSPTQRKLDRLVREREAMGAVNLLAEQEVTELEGRIATMVAEKTDLVSAIAKLRHGIGELNREGRERLLASFQAVDQHFRDLFVKLFGGGRAHLALTESADPLEAGLEIMASPPGKRLQQLSLLSGGEQALTALALLFAVFMTNPAPICVLDEVDAPLDDANVDRFCSLVEGIARTTRTRFLIVTHHRMTMARMDRLYGVTMAERGVSQLVSVDLAQAEALRDKVVPA